MPIQCYEKVVFNAPSECWEGGAKPGANGCVKIFCSDSKRLRLLALPAGFDKENLCLIGHQGNECKLEPNDLSMPEFIGYMGEGKKELPIINVTGIYHKDNPIFQTFTGSGEEQSKLLSTSSEIDIKINLREKFNHLFNLIDAHYPSFGGGQIVLILKVEKIHLLPLCDIKKYIIFLHPLRKHIYLIDNDIDIFSPEDVY